MEWHPVFAVGRARLQVSFTGGHLGEGCVTPARYETTDPVVQKVIESSESFRCGRIRLSAACCLSMAQAASAADSRHQPVPSAADHRLGMEQAASAADPIKFDTFEFASLDEVREFLRKEKGVPKTRLDSETDCRREARLLHFDFKIKQK